MMTNLAPKALPVAETELLREALALLQERLPEGWRLTLRKQAPRAQRSADCVCDLRAPEGAAAVLLFQVKPRMATRDVGYALEQLDAVREGLCERLPVVRLLVSRYFAPETRARIEALGSGYVDLTGNLRLSLERPALFLRDVGEQRDPWRGRGRPRGSLRGDAPAKVVRALVDFPPPISVPQLASISGASTGATYRVIELLEREEMLERVPRGAITAVRWRALLERWSRDYDFLQSNVVVSCLQPRGLPALLDSLRSDAMKLRYALTGALAIEPELAYAPPRLAMLYVDRPEEAMASLDLRPVDTGANVLLAQPAYDVIWERTQQIAGARAVVKSQVSVDLLSAPGRGPAEAQALLDWMEGREDAWRAR